MNLTKKQFKGLRNRFGTYLTFMFYLESSGVFEEHSEQLLDKFAEEHGFMYLEAMKSKDFKELLDGVVEGYLDGKSVREEFLIN